MTVKSRPGARAKILRAADELAHEVGPAHVSLDAVAARAGVSKGGLLYHFPSKLILLKALVEDHIDRFTAGMTERTNRAPGGAHALLGAYHDMSSFELRQASLPKSGVLAAMVQFPELVTLIAHFKRQMLDRLKSEGGDEALTLVVFLALEGLRGMQLMDMDILTPAETGQSLQVLEAMIDKAR